MLEIVRQRWVLAKRPAETYGARRFLLVALRMIGLFRKFLNTRAARVFFFLLIIPFVMWGVADVARNFGGGSSLATVGETKIEPGDFQAAYRQQLAQVGRMLGNKEPTLAMRQGVAAQTLEGLVSQAALSNEVRRLGLTVPDDALKAAVFAMPAFRGPSGAYDKQQLDTVLRQNNLSEGRFLELMRADLAQRQLLDAVSAGSVAPEVLVRQVFAFQHESRVVEVVELPLSAAAEPPAPAAEALQRFYDDDPGRYSAPAFRHIKVLVLSPETLARTVEVSDADAGAWFEAHRHDAGGEFGTPEKRSVEVVVAPDEAVARALAAEWAGGADWAAMQAAAAKEHATSAALDNVGREDLPGEELGTAAFAATPGQVVGPVKGAFGFQVVKVVGVVPGNEKTLADVMDVVKQRVAQERAVDLVPKASTQLEDILAAGNGFDQVPADLGAAAAEGMLDAQGKTKDGEPAPIPGGPAVRAAVLAAAFAAPLDEAPHLVEGPEGSYFAVVVDGETKPEVKPFASIEEQVREDFLHDARRRAQEVVAAKLLAEVKAGKSLEDAAVVAGLRAERTPALVRGLPVPGVSAQVAQAAFALGAQGVTMVDTGEGFAVVQLVAVDAPAAGSDPVGVQQLQTALNTALGQDMDAVYAAALRDRAKPTVNRAMLESLVQ